MPTITATGSVTVDVSFVEYTDNIAVPKAQYSSKVDSKEQLDSGTGTNQINRCYAASRTLTAASGTDDLNLSNLTDPIFGGTINFDKVKVLYIKNQEPQGANGSNLLIKAAPTAGWHALFNGVTITGTSPIKLGPQDELLITRKTTGIDCPTSNSTLRITNDGTSAGALNYDIVILGTT